MDWQAFGLSVRLATTVSALLLVMAVPLAYWLSVTRFRGRFLIESIVSLLYSLPYAVQPLAAAFSQLDPSLRDASAVLGASPWRTFVRITVPLSIEGFLAALVLTFAHTIREFCVVL